MKKRALLLGLILALAIVVPASATLRVGDRIFILFNLPDPFPANTPFHVEHGFGQINPKDDGPVSGYLFTLDVDGAEVPRPIRVTSVSKGPNGEVWQRMTWIYDFPNGLPAGSHVLRGKWFIPCALTDGPCDRPNERVSDLTQMPTVIFTP